MDNRRERVPFSTELRAAGREPGPFGRKLHRRVASLMAGACLVLTESDGPDWGYHDADVNVALGNLVADVAGAEASWSKGGHGK